MRLRTFTTTLVGLVIGLIAGAFSLTPAGDRIENRYALGLLYAIRQPIQPPPGAIVIAIDRQTLSWLRDEGVNDEKSGLLACMPNGAVAELSKVRGPGSLPRSIYACLLPELHRLGISVTAFDILFSVPGLLEDDQRLATAFEEYGRILLLVGYERSLVRDGASELLVEKEIKPLSVFRDRAAAIGGFVVTRTGAPVYGYWRGVAGFEDTKSLPEEALRLKGVQGEKTATPSDPFRYLWLYGTPGSIPTVSMQDVLRGSVPDNVRAAFATSVAFVGASDPDTTNYPDSFPTFFRGASDADISGVELAATAYLNLLHGEMVRRLSKASSFALIVFFTLGLTLFPQIGGRFALPAVICAALFYLAFVVLLFLTARVFLPLGTPLFIVFPAMLITVVALRYRFVRALIMHLAPAPVARRMLSYHTDERGQSITDEVTVVFFDLIGSTILAEKISALEFGKLLNAYFEITTTSVGKFGGYVSAFAGDGVVAVFPRANSGLEHAPRACRSILVVMQEVNRLNRNNAKVGVPPLAMRVGLNSGMVAAGEIGAHDRFNFSVVGDVVNLAARLEQLGKTLFPGEKDVILAGRSTWQIARLDGLDFIDCGICLIPGREKPEHVFRLRWASPPVEAQLPS